MNFSAFFHSPQNSFEIGKFLNCNTKRAIGAPKNDNKKKSCKLIFPSIVKLSSLINNLLGYKSYKSNAVDSVSTKFTKVFLPIGPRI